MPITIEQYNNFSVQQRKKVKRDELQTILDEHLNDDGSVASMRGIIREEMTTLFEGFKKELTKSVNGQIKVLSDENKKIAAENASIKKVLQEHQKALERVQKEETKNNIFISGLPVSLNAGMNDISEVNDNDAVTDHVEIIHHVLNFVNPGTEKEDYKILFNFEARENFSRHSAKIRVTDVETKFKIFKGCVKLKDLNPDNYLKKIFIKNDDPPLTRKENERLYIKLKELREKEDKDNPENRYYIKKGKLYKNGGDVVDEFNLSNQLFC